MAKRIYVGELSNRLSRPALDECIFHQCLADRDRDIFIDHADSDGGLWDVKKRIDWTEIHYDLLHPHDVLQWRLDPNLLSGTFTRINGFFLGNDHSWIDQCLEYDHLPNVFPAITERVGRFSEN